MVCVCMLIATIQVLSYVIVIKKVTIIISMTPHPYPIEQVLVLSCLYYIVQANQMLYNYSMLTCMMFITLLHT